MPHKPHDTFELIPPPAIVRDRLAHAIRETRLLRSLLALSIRAAHERESIAKSQTVANLQAIRYD
jgi:hypothetical protein